MSYTMADGRQQLLDDVAEAARQLGGALAGLTEAYEHLDEDSGDRLEQELFRPVQAALGTAKRTSREFAERYGLTPPDIPQPAQGRPMDPRSAITAAVEGLAAADETLSALQDSMLPVEVGDREVRAGLTHVRELIAPLARRAREELRTLGR